ncbi:hypothetical protein LTR17_026619 [Elasticomyces elasticus]|nr:hypothetical protein LTR17_026619 [Elasticomyces elasticus]
METLPGDARSSLERVSAQLNLGTTRRVHIDLLASIYVLNQSAISDPASTSTQGPNTTKGTPRPPLFDMCIARLTNHACGHAEKTYYNQHCKCALIVGPIVEASDRCPSRCAIVTPKKSLPQLPLTPPETPAHNCVPAREDPTGVEKRSNYEEASQDDTLYAALWGNSRLLVRLRQR